MDSEFLANFSFAAVLATRAANKPTTTSELPDSIKRVGTAFAFPNEYPGQIYEFNWCLNKDGVTPLKRSAFRVTKPLDLKVAGLTPPKTMPLKVRVTCCVIVQAQYRSKADEKRPSMRKLSR